MRQRLIKAATVVLGPACFLVRTLGIRYAVSRELRKVNRLGCLPTVREGIRILNSGSIQLGDNVTLGAYVDLICYAGGSITIGNNVFIGSGSVIHSYHVYCPT